VTRIVSDVFNVLLGIINQTGWVCQQCRIQRNELICRLQSATEVTRLKGNSRAANSAEANENDQTGVKTTSSNATASGQSPVVMDVQLEVHKTFCDMAKRKLNVIVTGLPETNCSDLDEMKAADTLSFMHLCETPFC